MRCIALVGMLVMVAGCPSDNNTQADAGACTCTPPTAEQVSYDKTSSQLGADNVQDAVDELAARPLAEAPLGPRLELVTQNMDNSGATTLDLTLPCPQATDVPLGGGCGAMFVGTLVGTNLGLTGYSCAYKQPAGNNEKPTVSVMCLHKAP